MSDGVLAGQDTDPTTATHPFTDLVTLEPEGAAPGRYLATIDPMWTIGPKVHGGALMAVLAAAARDRLRAEEPDLDPAIQPLAVTASYLSAPDPSALVVDTRIIKRGRRVTHVEVSAYQGEREYVRGLVVIGRPDPTAVRVDDPAVAEMPAQPGTRGLTVDSGHPLGAIIHIAQGIDLALDPNGAAFLEGRTGPPEIRLWVRLRPEDAHCADNRALFALMAGDVSPPVTLNLGRVGWAPTVQMSSYLRRIPEPGWLRLITRAAAVGTGWMDEDHLVIDDGGTVIAQCRQLAMPPASTPDGG